jgi:hypothetical protein
MVQPESGFRAFPRRQALRTLVGGSLLMPGILSRLLADDLGDPLASRTSHHPARAERVIFIFLSGGVSQLDTFDPKPRLIADHGKEISVEGAHGRKMKLVKSYWEFRPRGACGTPVSGLFPHLGGCADELCVIRSMKTDHRDHTQGTLGMHTGSVTFTRPSLGSWVSYGLGTANRNLPSFMVLAPYLPFGGEQVFSSDFLPAAHQGTRVVPGADPVPFLKPRSPKAQEDELALLAARNREHLASRDGDAALAARIRSFETAFGMQTEAPEAFDVSAESDATLRLYGLERGQTTGFAWQCLAARRLAERGVRFIELVERGQGMYDTWDSHENLLPDHARRAKAADQPMAALLKDLRSRGMLESTLVVITSEFGRPPFEDGSAGRGRGHQITAFSSLLAGGGVKGGLVHGATDDYGIQVAENPVHLHDFHATILHLMGLDHERLTYRHLGRDFRLTDVSGRVVREILT